MNNSQWIRSSAVSVLLIGTMLFTGSAFAADHLSGQVLGANSPIAKSTVVLWEASANAPRKLAETKTDEQGKFEIRSTGPHGSDTSLYLVASGGQPKAHNGSSENPAIVLLAVLGNKLPDKVSINEFTTIASVWTNAQFLNGTTLQGHALGLRIAAGNVPSFVDLQTGSWGGAIQDPLNSGQTTTMANFATLADVLAGCVTLIRSDACSSLFDAATSPTDAYPKDTLASAENIARFPWYQTEKMFGLLNYLYPIPQGKNMRAVPFMPYLNLSPSAWVLPLKFTGGGYSAGGKAMFDSQGNLWVGDNFTVGWQGTDSLWQGNATKFAPNGKPLSPITTGFAGGGMQGGTFGAAVDAKDNAWFGTYGGKSIAVFDKNGKPLTPPEGITFDGKLGLMQGIIATPNGDVWALGVTKSQLLYFPKGDPTTGRIVCEGRTVEPCKSFLAPFHLAIDQKDRIWVTNAFGAHVTRFPASDPSKVEKFGTGYSGSGMAIDSQGNAWVANRLGSSAKALFENVDNILTLKTGGNADESLTGFMYRQRGNDGGSVSLLHSDGTQFTGSPFTGGGLPGPWAVVVDGNDNVWISNFAMPDSPIVELCGARTETCPPGMKTGAQISPPGGYVGGGLEMQTDLAIGPAGDVWVMDNWQVRDSCFKNTSHDEALSTRCGGDGVTIFFGQAKPVHTPLIGPVRQP
jgi:hypothetical protein